MNRFTIADDNAFVRTGLYEFFESEADFRSVRSLRTDGKQVVSSKRRHGGGKEGAPATLPM
jgi:hypothetical protein